jgi:hypothetical protein
MTSARRTRTVADPRAAASTDEFRQMILLLETAAVLERRAAGTGDPVQATILRRRAEQRGREARRLRDELVARGAPIALDRIAEASSPRRPVFGG